jgi:hypothetical protein
MSLPSFVIGRADTIIEEKNGQRAAVIEVGAARFKVECVPGSLLDVGDYVKIANEMGQVDRYIPEGYFNFGDKVEVYGKVCKFTNNSKRFLKAFDYVKPVKGIIIGKTYFYSGVIEPDDNMIPQFLFNKRVKVFQIKIGFANKIIHSSPEQLKLLKYQEYQDHFVLPGLSGTPSVDFKKKGKVLI